MNDLEKKHYPIIWWVEAESNEIIIQDINNKKLPPTHPVYQSEIDFIREHIENEMEFSGEILCP
tara:strand:+ start:173 stop:364 length:192 start_codon:yes stop_codon:yes gene_type:complete